MVAPVRLIKKDADLASLKNILEPDSWSVQNHSTVCDLLYMRVPPRGKKETMYYLWLANNSKKE